MNVDFSDENFQLSMQESAMQISGNSEHVYSLPNPERMQENSSFTSENQGDTSASERLAMPKRPHNVMLLITNPFVILCVNDSW